MSLEKFLVDYNERDIYPMHMPGHKRNDEVMEMGNPYLIDVTEAGDLDNLHEPEGILAQAMQKASRVFGSKSTYFLVNGSTCGILAGICATVKKGGKVMLARPCHRSVYNGIYLRGAQAVYLYPPVDKRYGIYGSISPRALKMALRRRDDIDLVVLTSPTYEGVTTDIEAMAKICHRYDIPLLVDAAHGAHFGFTPDFPESAIRQGADIVVHSIHKTLPALTQTSLLHINSDLVDERKLRQFLAMFQSSSPSYVLMSGIDKCVDYLDSPKAAEDFAKYTTMLKEFSERMKELKKFRILCKGEDTQESHPMFFGIDPGKIVISTRGTEFTGAELEEILRDKYKIQVEMAFGDYVIAMTGVCDTQEGFDRLAEAMLELDEECDYSKECGQCGDKTICGDSPYCTVNAHVCTNIRYDEALNKEGFRPPRAPRALMRAADAIDAEGEAAAIDDAVGRIAQEYIYAFPPGVPLVVPGEPVSEEILSYIRQLEGSDTQIHSSLKGWEEGKIHVVTKDALAEAGIRLELQKGPRRAAAEQAEAKNGIGGRLTGLFHRNKDEEEEPMQLEDLLQVGPPEEEEPKPESIGPVPQFIIAGAAEEEILEPEEAAEILEQIEPEEEEPPKEAVEEGSPAAALEDVTLDDIEADLFGEETEETDEEIPEETAEAEEEPAAGEEEPSQEESGPEEVPEADPEPAAEEEPPEEEPEPAAEKEEPTEEEPEPEETPETDEEPAGDSDEEAAPYDPARIRFERLHAGAPILDDEEPIQKPFGSTGIYDRFAEPEPETPPAEPEEDPRARFEQLHRSDEGIAEEAEPSDEESAEPQDSGEFYGEWEPDETDDEYEDEYEEPAGKKSFWTRVKEFMALSEEDEFEDLEKERELIREQGMIEEPKFITASEEVHQEALSEYDTGSESEFRDLEDFTAEMEDLTEKEFEDPEE
ncbi:MAG: aminotransferase class V-fold PLP-dependent enzyme [Firmicutes bacterium]|nr:aminotransferase class V-fold PLP-dependent enzyme [Bacillota bacterium]